MLEVNGQHIKNLQLLKPLLSTRYGKITLTLLPIQSSRGVNTEGREVSMESEGASASAPPGENVGSRVHRARHLFSKVNTSRLLH